MTSAQPAEVATLRDALAGQRSELAHLNGEYERLASVQSSCARAAADAGDGLITALEIRLAAALTALAVGDAPEEDPDAIRAAIEQARRESEAKRRTKDDAAKALPGVTRRMEDAALAASRAADELARLERQLIAVLMPVYAEETRIAARVFYGLHCEHRSLIYLWELTDPKRGAGGIPRRGTFNFGNVPGLLNDDGTPFVLRTDDYVNDAERRVRELLRQLGVTING